MAKGLPQHIEGLRAYLSQSSERNEDLALTYFRHVYGDQFKRQSDEEAHGADGYVAGHFVLELKGSTSDWYSALFQGLAYKSKGLAFSLIIVAAKNFLAVWSVDDLPDEMRNEVLADKAAPNAVGKKYARKFATSKSSILRKAEWYRPELFDPLFESKPELFQAAIKSFEKTIEEERKVRQGINTKNFVKMLENMKQFFDPQQPLKTVRAFYSMIYGPWDDTSILMLNQRQDDRATLGGIEISNLIPNRRTKFKEFVENHSIQLSEKENIDDFFSRYDEALDAVDKEFRIRNGIFFTDLDLSKFVMWLVKQKIPHLGKNYLVIDPACGSGNLVTNWRSPLELRHKVVSEIEPELLYAVEQRMKGDQWHNGKFTVVPKVSENRGLNFLDKSATEYIDILKDYLKEKGQKPNKPIAFLCNPPYRSDDDQTAEAISYPIDPSILEVTGKDGSSERYSCFLAQMKLICKAAEESGLPDDSILLLFTKAAWLTKRPVFQQIRREMLSSFEDIGGVLVNGKEFFDVKGKFPIAFTMWRFVGDKVSLNSDRSIPMVDLTWLKKSDLSQLSWDDPVRLDKDCSSILKNTLAVKVHLGANQIGIREWTGEKRSDFQREKTKDEVGDKSFRCGLPSDDPRHERKKTLGHSDGTAIGFMDNLTPCRIRRNVSAVPYFHLDNRFMRVRAYRCFSGPPDNRSFSSQSPEAFERLAIWYSLGRTFAQCGYPMWADALELWEPLLDRRKREKLLAYVYSILFSENECVTTMFPAGNPVKDAIELHVNNPLSPLYTDSFWSKEIAPKLKNVDGIEGQLISSVRKLYSAWKLHLGHRKEITVSYEKPYFVGKGVLTLGAGIVQIRDYAIEAEEQTLLLQFKDLNELSKKVKEEFYKFIISEDKLNYFGQSDADNKEVVHVEFSPKTKFDHTIERRLAVAGVLVDALHEDKNFGRTKLTKLFYLADTIGSMDLQTDYYRKAAGPLDQRALYNEQIGIEPLAKRHGYFQADTSGAMVRYKPDKNLGKLVARAKETLGTKLSEVSRIIGLFKDLNTDQCEIVATLFACWNDLLIDDRKVTDELILKEFFSNWHQKKQRFPKSKVLNALKWMREQSLVPKGIGKMTSVKPDDNDFDAA